MNNLPYKCYSGKLIHTRDSLMFEYLANTRPDKYVLDYFIDGKILVLYELQQFYYSPRRYKTAEAIKKVKLGTTIVNIKLNKLPWEEEWNEVNNSWK